MVVGETTLAVNGSQLLFGPGGCGNAEFFRELSLSTFHSRFIRLTSAANGFDGDASNSVVKFFCQIDVVILKRKNANAVSDGYNAVCSEIAVRSDDVIFFDVQPGVRINFGCLQNLPWPMRRGVLCGHVVISRMAVFSRRCKPD